MINALLLFVLTLGIIAIKLGWMLTEPGSKRTQFERDYLKSNVVELVILVLQVLSAIYFPWPQSRFDGIFMTLGLLMYTVGTGLAIWARIIMHQSWGHPGQHTIKRQNKLVTQGPFRISRNPIYVGFLLIYFGYAIAIRSWFIFLRIPLLIYFYRSVLREEQNLMKYFGKQYQEYMQRVPRFLIV